jgi:elongation factor Ts
VSAISASAVKDLRERTGAGMMDCKRALTETEGDLDAAVKLLREKGLAGASKKSGRVTAEGLVGVYNNEAGTESVVVELNCETDFVAKNENFSELLDELGAALVAAEGLPDEGEGADVESLPTGSGKTIGERLKEAIASIGENLSLRRFHKVSAGNGRVASYVHAGGKIGVIVELSGATDDDLELIRSLAMQVAAAFPRWVRREEVDPDEVEREREIFKGQALASGKPENVVDRIVDGKIEKYFREVCLVEQEYVRDSQLTIEKLLAQVGKDSGRDLNLERFVRYQLGEGIEKRSENLADEVAAQIAKSS